MAGMTQMLVALGDLLMPRVCPVCGEALGMNEREICLHCAADLPLTYYWERSHNPMADRLNAALQDQEGMPYAYAAALFFYDDDVPYKMIPRRLKYENGIGTGRYFAAMLGRYLAGSEWFAGVEMVIPVPLHWTRRWKRGYNQAAVIARALAKELGAECREDVLFRRRRTVTQTRLGGDDRARNVRGAFGVRDRFLHSLRSVEMTKQEWLKVTGSEISRSFPLHILLVDDVLTTGSTTAECFRTLRAVYPKEVRISVATLAFVKE